MFPDERADGGGNARCVVSPARRGEVRGRQPESGVALRSGALGGRAARPVRVRPTRLRNCRGTGARRQRALDTLIRIIDRRDFESLPRVSLEPLPQSMPRPSQIPNFVSTSKRLALIAGATILGLAALWDWQNRRQATAELHEMTRELGLDQRSQALIERISSEPDPSRARLLLARAIIGDLLDPASRTPTTPGATTLEAQLEALAQAAELARTEEQRRPLAWRAPLVNGAAVYLERSLTRNEQLVRSPRDWEAPLERALELGPHESDPQRFVAMAYLELWPFLSDAKRDIARGLLRSVFSDPLAFRQLSASWLRIVEATPETLDTLPDEAHVWQQLRILFSSRQDWPLFIETVNRLSRLNDAMLRTRLEQGLAALERGDISEARAELQSTLGAPPSRSTAPIIEQALTRMPAGPLHRSLRHSARAWLDFTLSQCLYRGCPLSAGVLERIARQLDDLEPETSQQVRVVAGGQPGAGSAWNPLMENGLTEALAWLQAARVALRRNQPDVAATIADRAPAVRQHRLLRLELQGRAADGTPPASTVSDVSGTEVSAQIVGEWWSTQPGRFATEARLAGDSKTLRVPFDQLDAAGAAVEASWDGTSLGVFHVTRERPELTLAIDVAETTSLLEIRLLGGRARPLQVVVR